MNEPEPLPNNVAIEVLKLGRAIIWAVIIGVVLWTLLQVTADIRTSTENLRNPRLQVTVDVKGIPRVPGNEVP